MANPRADMESGPIRILFVLSIVLAMSANAQDADDVIEHPLISRYPGQDIPWQHIENFQPYRVPTGPVTGYRTIGDWIDTQGRVTRTFYRYRGEERTFSEIYLNYLESLRDQDFEILLDGVSADRRGTGPGSRQWAEVLFRENVTSKPGEVTTMFAGTSSSGGAAALVAHKERAAGNVYVVINVEQHAADYVGALIDIVEVAAAETGLVVVDPEAIGNDIEEYGRVVLDGLFFEHDKATLMPESDGALAAVATYLASLPDGAFYVVGHTDSTGAFAYNRNLSADRARSVVDALVSRSGIDRERLEPHGVGPLSPVFNNAAESGRERNRRVELVQQ